jgi:hypothetical protein
MRVIGGVQRLRDLLDAGGRQVERAVRSYPDPGDGFRPIKDHLAFYASRVDGCWASEKRVRAQEGDFYGGWITVHVVGLFNRTGGW